MDTAMAELPAAPLPEPVAEGSSESGEATEGKLLDSSKPWRTGPLKIAIVGRPNVGKSSIVNALTQSERVIVSPIPGTTRDAVDVPFSVETEGVLSHYILIDTAGMRKSRRVDDSIEFFSVQRSEESIIRSDITVLVIDAEEGITEQDKKIADVIVENRRACIVVINKWDLFDEEVRAMRRQEIVRREKKVRREGQAQELTTLVQFGQWVQEKLFFLDYAPVIFTSAKSGFHLDRLLETIRYVAAQLQQKVPTAILNRTLRGIA
jgi:GTP-binding protein